MFQSFLQFSLAHAPEALAILFLGGPLTLFALLESMHANGLLRKAMVAVGAVSCVITSVASVVATTFLSAAISATIR